jgi:hypothetical protein
MHCHSYIHGPYRSVLRRILIGRRGLLQFLDREGKLFLPKFERNAGQNSFQGFKVHLNQVFRPKSTELLWLIQILDT